MSFVSTSETLGPADDEVFTMTFTGRAARRLVAMLNMNTLRNAFGQRVTYRWVKSYDKWLLEETTHDD